MNAKDNNGYSALMTAAENGHKGIADLIKKAGKKIKNVVNVSCKR